MGNGNLLKSCVSEIPVKRIRLIQEVDVLFTKHMGFHDFLMEIVSDFKKYLARYQMC